MQFQKKQYDIEFIDGLPFDQNELEFSLHKRIYIFNRILSYIPLHNFIRIAKTTEMRVADAKEISTAQGKLDGYNNSLKDYKQELLKIVEPLQELTKQKIKLENETNDITRQLEYYDSEELIIFKNITQTKPWRLLRIVSTIVDERHAFPCYKTNEFIGTKSYIYNVDLYPATKPYHKYEQNRDNYYAYVKSYRNRTLKVSVDFYTKKK